MLDILFLLHIGKDWFMESKLSVVVPQAIGISLRNRIGVCDSGFHHSRWITLCMAFPCPAADFLYPMDHLLSFDVSLIIPSILLWTKEVWVPYTPLPLFPYSICQSSDDSTPLIIPLVLLFKETLLPWLVVGLPMSTSTHLFQRIVTKRNSYGLGYHNRQLWLQKSIFPNIQ